MGSEVTEDGRLRVGLISDTHGQLRREVFTAFRDVDLILHAGDVGAVDILIELGAIAPVHAVRGNTDGPEIGARAEEALSLELAGHRIVVVHGHQLGVPTPVGLRAAFPDADVIVYGHTHRQLIDEEAGRLVVNPGAAGPARFRLQPCVAVMTISPGEQPDVELVPLTARMERT